MLAKKNPAYQLIRILFLFSIVFPFLVLILLSFSERYTWPGILPGNYSLRAIRSILFQRKALFLNCLFSIFFSVMVSLCTIMAAYCTAKWQSEHKESSLLSFCIFLPFMIPPSVFAMGAQILFLRLPFKNAYLSVFLSHVLYSLPYATTYLTEGIRNNIKRLEEQGRVFGASGFYLLFKVTIPLLFPYLIPAFMMSFILSMSQYILTVLLGGGKLKTLSLIMVPFIQSGERNLASVYGLLFLLSSFLLFLLMEILLRGLKRREKAC